VEKQIKKNNMSWRIVRSWRAAKTYVLESAQSFKEMPFGDKYVVVGVWCVGLGVTGGIAVDTSKRYQANAPPWGTLLGASLGLGFGAFWPLLLPCCAIGIPTGLLFRRRVNKR
jgi:hypothetical protein